MGNRRVHDDNMKYIMGSFKPIIIIKNKLEHAFNTSGRVWIHGSGSPALKMLARESALGICLVSDIVRSDTECTAKPTRAQSQKTRNRGA